MSSPRRIIRKKWRPYPLGSNREVCKVFDKFTVIKIVIKCYPEVQVAEPEEQDPVGYQATLIGRMCRCFRSLVTTKVVKLEIDDGLRISPQSYEQVLAGCKILKCRSLEFNDESVPLSIAQCITSSARVCDTYEEWYIIDLIIRKKLPRNDLFYLF